MGVTSVTNDKVEAFARKLAISHGHDPDRLITTIPPYELQTPIGRCYDVPLCDVRPLWTAYAPTALVAIETLNKEKIT